MQFINNDPKQIEIRRAQNTLIVVGSGTFLFGIWTTVKMMTMFFLLKEESIAAVKEFAGPSISGLTDRTVYIAIGVFLLLLMLIDLGARAYAGLSAISEGRGKSHRRFYLVIAALLMIGSFTSGISSILMNETPQGMGAFTKDISLSAIIIDFTSALMLAELLAASVRIRKLSRLGKHAKK